MCSYSCIAFSGGVARLYSPCTTWSGDVLHSITRGFYRPLSHKLWGLHSRALYPHVYTNTLAIVQIIFRRASLPSCDNGLIFYMSQCEGHCTYFNCYTMSSNFMCVLTFSNWSVIMTLGSLACQKCTTFI